jgi:uncharacterized protein (DUF1697 family)
MRYVALLRGINVGGNNMIKMIDLKQCLETAGFDDVSTYIMSGNVFFSSEEADEPILAKKIEHAIEDRFGFPVRVVVISHAQMKRIISAMPKDWGNNTDWKYNTLFIFPPHNAKTVLAEIGELKPDIEVAIPTEGAILQAVELKSFGRSTFGKNVASPIIKEVTIRNLNTTRKLMTILDAML